MRRIIIAFLTIVMLILSVTLCYAAEPKSEGDRGTCDIGEACTLPCMPLADKNDQRINILRDTAGKMRGQSPGRIQDKNGSGIGKNKGILYKHASSATVKLSIYRGKAVGWTSVNSKSSGVMTSAIATLTFVRKKSGKSKSYSGKMSKSGLKYTFSSEYKLPQRGKYYVKVTINCYKNGKHVETIKKVSALKKY